MRPETCPLRRPRFEWLRGAKGVPHEASLGRRCGDCRAGTLGASLGATCQSGRKRFGCTRPQSRWAWSDAVQHGRTSIHTFGLRHNLADATGAPSCARPPCGEHARDAPCPWPQVGDGHHRTAEPSRARPPAGGYSPDGTADGPAPTTHARGEQHGYAGSQHGRTGLTPYSAGAPPR